MCQLQRACKSAATGHANCQGQAITAARVPHYKYVYRMTVLLDCVIRPLGAPEAIKQGGFWSSIACRCAVVHLPCLKLSYYSPVSAPPRHPLHRHPLQRTSELPPAAASKQAKIVFSL